MMIDNIRVTVENGTISPEAAKYYVGKLRESSKRFTLKKVNFSRSDDYLDIRYSFNEIPLQRIRRIPFAERAVERAV